MLNINSTVKNQFKNILTEQLGQEWIVYDDQSEIILIMNNSAYTFWSLIKANDVIKVSELLKMIAPCYPEVDISQVKNDLLEFLEILQSEMIINAL